MLRESFDGGVATLTLARAERGNALSPELVEGLLDGVARACADPSIHALLLRADGPHFCTGFDLSDLDSCTDGDLLARFVRIETLLATIWHAPIHTIALARGRAWGAGADLFAVCDTRIASDDASFRFPGAGFGLVLGTRRLTERVGPDAARDWVTRGLSIDAALALRTGLASHLAPVPHDDAAARAAGSSANLPAVAGGDALDAACAAACASPAVNRATVAAIRAASRADHRDTDLASLVRSAAVPGLVARIVAYRDALRGHRSASPTALPNRDR